MGLIFTIKWPLQTLLTAPRVVWPLSFEVEGKEQTCRFRSLCFNFFFFTRVSFIVLHLKHFFLPWIPWQAYFQQWFSRKISSSSLSYFRHRWIALAALLIFNSVESFLSKGRRFFSFYFVLCFRAMLSVCPQIDRYLWGLWECDRMNKCRARCIVILQVRHVALRLSVDCVFTVQSCTP